MTDWWRTGNHPMTVPQLLGIVILTLIMTVGLVCLVDARTVATSSQIKGLKAKIHDLTATIDSMQTKQGADQQRIAEMESQALALVQQIKDLGAKPVVEIHVDPPTISSTTPTRPSPSPAPGRDSPTTTTTTPGRGPSPPTPPTTSCLVPSVTISLVCH